MPITLYQAALDIQHKIALCVAPDTGEIDVDKLHAIEATFLNKGVAVTAVIKTMQNQIEGLIAQQRNIVKQYSDAIELLMKKEKRLNDYLRDAMKATGISNIKSDDGLLEATLYIDRDESIELDEGVQFAESLLNPQKPAPTRTPSKDLIKKAILAGEAVKGARIVRKDRLTIK